MFGGGESSLLSIAYKNILKNNYKLIENINNI